MDKKNFYSCKITPFELFVYCTHGSINFFILQFTSGNKLNNYNK